MFKKKKKKAGHGLSMGEIRTVYTVLVRQHTIMILLEDLDKEKNNNIKMDPKNRIS
jgi:hypothetical protein